MGTHSLRNPCCFLHTEHRFFSFWYLCSEESTIMPKLFRQHILNLLTVRFGCSGLLTMVSRSLLNAIDLSYVWSTSMLPDFFLRPSCSFRKDHKMVFSFPFCKMGLPHIRKAAAPYGTAASNRFAVKTLS